jgi:hypothetical protein
MTFGRIIVNGDLTSTWKEACFKVQIIAGRNENRNDEVTFQPASFSRLEHEIFYHEAGLLTTKQ